MYWISIFLVIAALLWSTKLNNSVAVAQADSQDKKRECITLLEEQTAALTAEDWTHLEKLAKRYLQDCKEVSDSENYSFAHESIAIANIRLNNPAAALEASKTCIDVYYTNVGCHVTKIRALINLQRVSDARASFEIAERLVAHVIEINERDLHETSDPLEKKVYAAKEHYLNAQKGLLDSIRPLLYR